MKQIMSLEEFERLGTPPGMEITGVITMPPQVTPSESITKGHAPPRQQATSSEGDQDWANQFGVLTNEQERIEEANSKYLQGLYPKPFGRRSSDRPPLITREELYALMVNRGFLVGAALVVGSMALKACS